MLVPGPLKLLVHERHQGGQRDSQEDDEDRRAVLQEGMSCSPMGLVLFSLSDLRCYFVLQ